MLLNDREQILALTREWKGERYENGRPKVSDEKIEILKTLTQEEIWQPLYACGYRFQFQGNMRALHEDKKLYGRAAQGDEEAVNEMYRRFDIELFGGPGKKGQVLI